MLQIDMLEEPEDEDDLIFLAQNKIVCDKYVFVIKNGGIENFKSVVASIGDVFSKVGKSLKDAIIKGGGLI